ALERRGDLSPEAYASYLRGRHFWRGRALNFPENAQLAADQFESVIGTAPGYAPGSAALGEARVYLARYLHAPQEQPVVRRARTAVARALALDGASAAAQATLGLIKFRIDWDWIGAEDNFRRAVASEPNNAEIRLQRAILLAYGGRYEEAQREVQV